MLCIDGSTNDCESTMSIDFELTSKFLSFGKLLRTESTNNEDYSGGSWRGIKEKKKLEPIPGSEDKYYFMKDFS